MIENHWSTVFFKQPIISVEPLKGGRQHQIDLITLVDQSKWICKKLSRQTWLGEINAAQLEWTEVIAAMVASELEISFAAYHHETGIPVLTVNDSYALIIPYCEGLVVPLVTKRQAFLLGKLLAQLHSMKLPGASAEGFPAISLPENDSCPSWLQAQIERCNYHRQYEVNQWVVSHRDVHMNNIIWCDTESPHLIDWESAGFIHPSIELVGVATNCSGMAIHSFDAERFQSTLMGYGQCMGKLPKMDTILWELTLHSWLLWYSHSLRQGWQDDAILTLQAIELILVKLNEMKQLYERVYLLFNK